MQRYIYQTNTRNIKFHLTCNSYIVDDLISGNLWYSWENSLFSEEAILAPPLWPNCGPNCLRTSAVIGSSATFQWNLANHISRGNGEAGFTAQPLSKFWNGQRPLADIEPRNQTLYDRGWQSKNGLTRRKIPYDLCPIFAVNTRLKSHGDYERISENA